MEVWQPLCTGSPLTPINTYSGTAMTPYPINAESSVHYYTGPKVYAPSKKQLEEEQAQIHRVLSTCKYPGLAINRMKLKTSSPVKPKNNNKDAMSKTNHRSYITVPYMKGLSESIKSICKRYGIQVYFKSRKTIKDQLMEPKDKEHITKKSQA